jgi:hypothetical protein
MRHLHARVIACFAVLIALSYDMRAGEPSLPTFVPWKVLNPGDEPLHNDLVLYWVPSSRDEVRRSPLLTSRTLAVYSTQCVGMQLIRPDDDARLAKLEVNGALPTAILTTSDGTIVAHVASAEGLLRLSDVEKMVRDTLLTRDVETDRLLDEAKTKADAGEHDQAVALYRRVCAQRCLFPRKAKEALKALRKLGVEER